MEVTVMKGLRALSLALVGLALLVPVRHGSANAERDALCATTAPNLVASNYHYSVYQAAVITGCAQDSNGDWFWPTVANDPRLALTVLTPEQAMKSNVVLSQLADQINQFDQFLSAQYDAFNPASSAKPNLLVSVNALTAGGTSYGWGGEPELNGPGIKSASAWYSKLLLEFASTPDHAVFANYVAWWSQRRYEAMPASVDKLNPLARDGYIDSMAFGRAPWPWELHRFYTQSQFQAWSADSGYAVIIAAQTPTAVVTYSPTRTPTPDCRTPTPDPFYSDIDQTAAAEVSRPVSGC